MKALRLGLALVLTLAAQTTLAHTATGNRAVLDLVLVLVVFVGLRTNAVAGLLFGSLAGLCQDALSGGLIGVGGLAKSIAGAAAGALATQFIVTNALPRFMVFLSKLKSLHRAAIQDLQGFSSFRIESVPREQNKEADRLANEAIRRRIEQEKEKGGGEGEERVAPR